MSVSNIIPHLCEKGYTITRYAYERMAAGKSMPGVVEVTFDAPIGRVIEDILILLKCSLEGELAGQIQYLPL